MSRRCACQREEATVHASESGSNVGPSLLLCDVGARRATVAKRSVWTIGASRSKFAPSAPRTAGELRHSQPAKHRPQRRRWAAGEEEMRKGIYRVRHDRLRASTDVFPSMLAPTSHSKSDAPTFDPLSDACTVASSR